MRLWGFVFFVLPIAGLVYTFWRTWCLLPFSTVPKTVVLGVMLVCFLMMFSTFGLFDIDRLPIPVATAIYEVGNSSIFVMLYMVMLYLLMDLGRVVHVVPPDWMYHSWKGTGLVTAVIVSLFTYGYFHYMHKTRQTIALQTTKPHAAMRIVMASDLHVGYHNQVDELSRWVDMINAENPDLVLIGGDIIDGRIRPLLDQNAAAVLRRIKAPVVACLGNHEYFTGLNQSQAFYKDAGIMLLRDSTMTIKDVNIIGRDDRTNPRRKSLAQLMENVDKSRYTILLDHQPYHLEEAEACGIDFQFSGHTHHGQVWPISWITDAIYEDAFGPLTKGNTRYYVSSGLGIWGAKFRIGTRSEYVVATLK